MVTNDQPGDRWMAVLRRRHAHTVDGSRKAATPDAFEIIFSGCGDDPGRDCCEVAPKLQRVRGPSTIRTALAAYGVHLSLRHPGRDGFPAEAITDAG